MNNGGLLLNNECLHAHSVQLHLFGLWARLHCTTSFLFSSYGRLEEASPLLLDGRSSSCSFKLRDTVNNCNALAWGRGSWGLNNKDTPSWNLSHFVHHLSSFDCSQWIVKGCCPWCTRLPCHRRQTQSTDTCGSNKGVSHRAKEREREGGREAGTERGREIIVSHSLTEINVHTRDSVCVLTDGIKNEWEWLHIEEKAHHTSLIQQFFFCISHCD